jgi:hypothetical protein
LQILIEKHRPMSTGEMMIGITAASYWQSGGKTPAATIYAAIVREMQVRGENARFRKVGPCLFEAASEAKPRRKVAPTGRRTPAVAGVRHDVPSLESLRSLIYKQASKCLAKMPDPSPVDADDLYQEAAILYCHMAKMFLAGPRTNKFITYFWQGLWRRFGAILAKAYRDARCAPGDVDADEQGRKQENTTDCIDSLQHLPQPTKKFIQFVLNPEAAGIFTKNTACRQRRAAVLAGLDTAEMVVALGEIRQALTAC